MTTFDFDQAIPYAGATLYAALRRECGPEWDAYVGHRFVRELAAGTLDHKEFLAWMVQDYLYLIHYTRAFALLVYKSETVAEMRGAAAIVHGLLESEMTLHRQELDHAGVSAEILEQAEESLETLAYSRYILDRAMAGDALDLMVALAACLAGYGEIGLRLKADPATRLEGNPYRAWIETYAGKEYNDLAREGVIALEGLSRRLGGLERFPQLLRQFRQCVRLETAFWEAGRSAPLILAQPQVQPVFT